MKKTTTTAMTTKTMSSSCRYIVLGTICVAFMAVQLTDALMCYQCADTRLDSPCYHDFEGLTNTSKGLNQTYAKNCTSSNSRWDRCVIESHRKDDGVYTLFQRGCHDGVYFNSKIEDEEFVNLTANNYTTCAYVNNRLVCFTFCDDDYCNGPLPVWDECDWANTTEVELCAGIGIHDNGLTTMICNILMLFVVWSFTHYHNWG